MVGAGAVAARHVRTLLAMDGVELAAVADPALERAKELAAEAGAAAYPNHMELLAAERLDAVYICVPPFAHGAPELAVIDAGLPMFVEKPVAIDQETAAEIAARLAGRSLVTCTGYHWRWLDIFDRAADLLADRPARLVQCSWLDKVPRRPGGCAVTARAARRSSRPPTSSTPPGAWPATWPRSTPSAPGQRSPGPGPRRTRLPWPVGPRTGRVADGGAEGARVSTARVPGAPATLEASLPAADIHDVSVASLRFASGAVGTVASTCLLPRLHRAGVQVVADGLSLELSETELVVEVDGRRDGLGRPAATPGPGRTVTSWPRSGGARTGSGCRGPRPTGPTCWPAPSRARRTRAGRCPSPSPGSGDG